MLIALINPIMTVYTVRGGQRKGSKHICNFWQNVERIATVLPNLPNRDDIPLIVRRSTGDNTAHYDFLVRRDKVTKALQWLKENNRWYQHITMSMDRLSQLPENGNLEDNFVDETIGPVLGWAMTIHKSQGLTLSHVVLDLGEKEMNVGISYVGCSRVKSYKGLAFTNSFPWARMQKINDSEPLKNVKDELERLLALIPDRE
jgi:Domain of unknown function (DUF6570)